MINLSRRFVLTGLLAAITAGAANKLMPIKSIIKPIPNIIMPNKDAGLFYSPYSPYIPLHYVSGGELKFKFVTRYGGVHHQA
jgi:hypothetical protein